MTQLQQRINVLVSNKIPEHTVIGAMNIKLFESQFTMKNYALLFLFVLGAVAFGQAQDDASRNYKKATRALGAYNLDPGANSDKLDEALEMINSALTDPEIAADAASWNTKGSIMLEVANRDYLNALKQKENAPPATPDAAYQGFTAFKKGLELATKKYHRTDAYTGISSLLGLLNNEAIIAYKEEKNEEAFTGFSNVIEAHNILVKAGEKSPLEEAQVKDAMFSAALTGMFAGKKVEALVFLNELVDAKYENPYIYDLLYTAYIDTDKDKAVSYLEKGRSLYPDEISLLFTEINHYLREGRMDELVGKLKMAIEKEPENKSLYLTLGNVYDNLFQKALEAKDQAAADKNFSEALNYYQQALSKDENYTDAIYSIGALYYNKAAVYTQELSVLADDYSKEGLKKYDALKEKVNGEFDKALPYFQKAEKVDANDMNTLIALKEIYARKNDLELSNEFKTRIERVQSGEMNATSYFK